MESSTPKIVLYNQKHKHVQIKFTFL